MKLIYTLKENPAFIQSFETTDELIVWLYKWQGKHYPSTALKEIIQKYYHLN